VEVARKQALLFIKTDADRHLTAVGDLINSAPDPVNVAKKLARRLGRVNASLFLDPKLVNAGCRGWFRT
jgi:hypothetical protein